MSPNSDCYSKEQLIACLEGTLPAGEREAVETHVASCEACAKMAKAVKELLSSNGTADGKGNELPDDSSERGNTPTRKSERDPTPLDDDMALSRTLDYLGKLKSYDIIRVLGRGGYGTVFEAVDNTLHRNVAIKLLNRELAKQAISRRRFIREARAGAAINHPNVVTIHAVDESGDSPFLVMELIEGETLRERIRRDPKLDLLDILRISAQIANGLAAAHTQGIIHRDVKPGNIMLVNPTSRVKIADFGLARVAAENVELTSQGVAIGTPAYMSPEQVRGEELDARSDLFAMGCVMYSMVTGHSPFHGKTSLDIAMRIESHQPPRLAEVSKGIPEFLDDIVTRLLEKDRDKRFRSAAEVADVVSRHLAILNQTPTDQFPVALRMSMFKPTGESKRRRRPIVISLVATFTIALIAGGWFYFGSGGTDAKPSLDVNGSLESTSPPSVSVGQRQLEVSVSHSGGGDFQTIGEALRHVAVGGTVTIEDDAEYIETIRLTDAARYAGVRIVSPKHATLRSNSSSPVVTIRSIPGLRWEGLNVLAPQMQLGIEVGGECPGLEIIDTEIHRIENPAGVDPSIALAGIVLRYGAAGTVEEPILLRGLKLHDTEVGIVIGNSSIEAGPPKHIVIERCVVHGFSREKSTLLAMLFRMEGVSIHHNIFSNGIRGISIVVEDQNMPLQCDITHNTWHRLNSWFGWTGSAEPPLSIQIHHNLIVDSMQYRPPPNLLDAINSLPPVFTGNTVVDPSRAGGNGFDYLADVVAKFPLLSLDPAHPDYLKPDYELLKQSGFIPETAPGRYSADAEN